ncbi:transposase [Actinospica acidithermotolerans]|uniref:transposase n=1 Tax=Actinospica acidithermotolerans TaxID=2828514 RepID=UPI003556A847
MAQHGSGKRYRAELKRDAVESVRSSSDRTVAEIAAELGVGGQSLRNWDGSNEDITAPRTAAPPTDPTVGRDGDPDGRTDYRRDVRGIRLTCDATGRHATDATSGPIRTDRHQTAPVAMG